MMKQGFLALAGSVLLWPTIGISQQEGVPPSPIPSQQSVGPNEGNSIIENQGIQSGPRGEGPASQQFNGQQNVDPRQPEGSVEAQRPLDGRDAAGRGSFNAQGDLSGTDEQNRWRYKWHHGVWWYWTPQDRWVVWMNNQWQPYAAELFSSGPAPSTYSGPTHGYGSSGYGYSGSTFEHGRSSYGYPQHSYSHGHHGGSGIDLNYGSPRTYNGYRGFGGYPGNGYGGYGSPSGGYGPNYGGSGRSGAGFSVGPGGVNFGARF